MSVEFTPGSAPVLYIVSAHSFSRIGGVSVELAPPRRLNNLQLTKTAQ